MWQWFMRQANGCSGAVVCVTAAVDYVAVVCMAANATVAVVYVAAAVDYLAVVCVAENAAVAVVCVIADSGLCGSGSCGSGLCAVANAAVAVLCVAAAVDYVVVVCESECCSGSGLCGN